MAFPSKTLQGRGVSHQSPTHQELAEIQIPSLSPGFSLIHSLKTPEVCITSPSGHAEGCREPEDKSYFPHPHLTPGPILFESHHPHLKPYKSLGRILLPWPSLPFLAICIPHVLHIPGSHSHRSPLSRGCPRSCLKPTSQG